MITVDITRINSVLYTSSSDKIFDGLLFKHHRLVNRDVATHVKKIGLAIFYFLALIAKGYQSRHYFSLKNISFVHLCSKGERKEHIRFRTNFSKKI